MQPEVVENKVSDLIHNTQENDENNLRSYSKVVDENGEPMVVYYVRTDIKRDRI